MDHLIQIEASYEGLHGPLPPIVVTTGLLIDIAYVTIDEYSIYHWDEGNGMNKAHCLDFGSLVTSKEVENNLGIDIGIVPMFWGDMITRGHIDNDGIWAKTVKIAKV